jgi:hypothetical protein
MAGAPSIEAAAPIKALLRVIRLGQDRGGVIIPSFHNEGWHHSATIAANGHIPRVVETTLPQRAGW